MSKLSYYVQDWNADAVRAVSEQRNAVAIKCHSTHSCLDAWRKENPGAEVFLRLHNSNADLDTGTKNIHRWREFTEILIRHADNQTVRPDVLFTPYNEVAPYSDTSIRADTMRKYVDALSQSATLIRAAGYKVAAGNWSVTTPHPRSSWDIIADCFEHIDYLALHGYSQPTLVEHEKELYPHESAIEYLRESRLPIPRFVLGEFGVDHKLYGIEFGGWRKSMTENQLAGQLKKAESRLQSFDNVTAAFWFIAGASSEWVSYDPLGAPAVERTFSLPVSRPSPLAKEPPAPPAPPKSQVTNAVLGRPWLPAELGTLLMEWRTAAEHNGDAPDPYSPEERTRFFTHARAIGAWRDDRPKIDAAIVDVCKDHGFEPAAIQAVIDIECGGKGCAPDGRPIIRLEAHLLFRAVNPQVFADVIRIVDTDGDGKLEWDDSHEMRSGQGFWIPYHGDQGREWRALELAVDACVRAGFQRDLPFRCASWGLGQILGREAEALGYESAEKMGLAFHSDEGEQLKAMVRFIGTSWRMKDAIKNHDFLAFAERYNGYAQRHRYAALLEQRYHQYT